MIIRAACIPEKVNEQQTGWIFFPEMLFEGSRVFEVQILRDELIFLDRINEWYYHHTWMKIVDPLWGTILRPHQNAGSSTAHMVGRRYMFIPRSDLTNLVYLNIGARMYYWLPDAIKFDTKKISIDIGGEELFII